MANKFFLDLGDDDNTSQKLNNFLNNTDIDLNQIEQIHNQANNEANNLDTSIFDEEDNKVEQIQTEHKTRSAVKTFRIVVLLITVAATGFFLYTALKKDKPEPQQPKTNTVEQVKSIEITEELLTKLVSLIPYNKNCNTSYYLQYTDDKFVDAQVDKSELNSNYCSKMPKVYTYSVGATSDAEHVYLVALVLIYDPITNRYGQKANTYNIEYGDIDSGLQDDGNGNKVYSVELDSIKLYGQKYKYTFTRVSEGVFLYTSTEPYTEALPQTTDETTENNINDQQEETNKDNNESNTNGSSGMELITP